MGNIIHGNCLLWIWMHYPALAICCYAAQNVAHTVWKAEGSRTYFQGEGLLSCQLFLVLVLQMQKEDTDFAVVILGYVK